MNICLHIGKKCMCKIYPYVYMKHIDETNHVLISHIVT